MRYLPALVLLFLFSGCGGGTGSSISGTPPAPVSTWAGTYAGTLNFSGCPSTGPCSGDAVSMAITEAANTTIPGEFSPTLTFTGTDTTANKTISGTGTALYYGAAPVGPGSESTNANANITPGGSIFLAGNGQSSTGPVLIQTIAVRNTTTVNGTVVVGPLYGTLTRVQ